MSNRSPMRLVRCVRSFVVLTTLVLSASSQPKQITILHTNDIHAHFLPHEAFWVRKTPKPMVGGFNELAFAIDSVRKTRPTTLLLDAGDLMTGTPISDRRYLGAEGGALMAMMNLCGYEGTIPGNHDFDISYSNALKLFSIAKFPVISSNLVDEASGEPITHTEYEIYNKGGLKIGAFALMSDDFYNLVSHKSTVGIKLLPTVETANRMAKLLAPQVDLVVAITHEGADEDSVLAMRTSGIDVIVGGHSHTRLTEPKFVNGVVIVQAGAYCENLGVLDLTVDHHKVTAYHGVLHELWYNPNHSPTAVTALVDSFKNDIDKEYGAVIATLKSEWNMQGWESGVGDFLSDAQREEAGADVGFMNNTGIRSKLSPGPMTKQDLFEVLPFRNELVKFPLTGKEIRAIVLYDIERRPGIQESGIACEWKRDSNGGIEIVSLRVNGKPLDENASYTGAASDYMTGESKRYLGIDIPNTTFVNETVFDAVLKKVLEEKTIDSKIEGRIKEEK